MASHPSIIMVRPARVQLLFAAVAFLISATIGCAPAVRLPAPPGWPAEISGRRLYNTPNTYIYASNDAAAGEADRVVQSAVAELSARGGAFAKGVVMVTDIGDVELGSNPRRFYRAIDAENYGSDCPDDGEERFAGMSNRLELLCRPIVIPRSAALDELSLPPEAAASWVVALPTRAMIDRGMARSMAKGLHDEHDPGWKAARVAALIVYVPLNLPINRESVAIERDVLIFTQMFDRQAKWSEAKRTNAPNEFRDRLVAGRMWYMPAMWFPPM
jgi:hypothetical protein